jgi:spore maturation protein CgeB
MKIALFYHSLVSDWNHGNAHFLRGIASELITRGHEVIVYEPQNGWSRRNLVAEQGDEPIAEFYEAYPHLQSQPYENLDIARTLDGVSLAIVHEWNEPHLVAQIGRYRKSRRDLCLLFHDTHHRAVTSPEEIAAFDLAEYDGALVYGEVLRKLYLQHAWANRVWTWHEAADVRIFRPMQRYEREGDLVWIGNWGDGERAAELHEFLVQPCRTLGLKATVHGVRYPAEARAALAEAGIEYGGWIANFKAPAVFARFRVTVHVPRGPYVHRLPGIPTIRPFEALACGIPLVSAPWDDVEGLFTPGRDFLVAHSGTELTEKLHAVLKDPSLARSLAEHGLLTVLARHTCAHRVDELLAIHTEVSGKRRDGAPRPEKELATVEQRL